MSKRKTIIDSVFNMTTLFIKHHNKEKIAQQKQELITYSASLKKERAPEYEINKATFNSRTHTAKIDIIQIQCYRTIERYVTKNYQRYPIYSQWKEKRKTIVKNIKLNNEDLENLNNHNDWLIALLSTQIINSLQNLVPLPSWYVAQKLKKDYDNDLEKIDKEKFDNLEKNSICQKAIIDDISSLEKEKKPFIKPLVKYKKKLCKREKKRNTSRNIKKQAILNNKILEIEQQLSILITQIEKLVKERNSLDKKRQKIHLLYEKQKEELQKEYYYNIGLIKPLNNDIKEIIDEFIPIKDFLMLPYKKIIGIYIIKNLEKNKYYVGQSKDIFRRTKQHFKGFEPNNIIFAEDYYSSSLTDKSSLFQIKVIECKTKDELDNKEKELIKFYDAKENGYNKTLGNT